MNMAGATRVLVVDDHPVNARLVQIVLTRAGLRAWTVHNAPSAVEFLRHNTVEVIITDIAMPGMTGTELLMRVRERFGSMRPRVIAYTAFALEHERAAITAAGFDGLLVKPSTPEQIIAAVTGDGT